MDEFVAIGITNQRETTVVWNKETGKPIYNAIVWQCRRTAKMIDKLNEDGLKQKVIETTGLIPDAYFSASKIAWILENVEGASFILSLYLSSPSVVYGSPLSPPVVPFILTTLDI